MIKNDIMNEMEYINYLLRIFTVDMFMDSEQTKECCIVHLNEVIRLKKELGVDSLFEESVKKYFIK